MLREDCFGSRSRSSRIASSRRCCSSLHLNLEAQGSPLEVESALLNVFAHIAEKHASAPVQLSAAGADRRTLSAWRKTTHALAESIASS